MFYEGEARRCWAYRESPLARRLLLGAASPAQRRVLCWGKRPLCPAPHTRRDLQVWKGHMCISALLAWLPKLGRKEAKKCS